VVVAVGDTDVLQANDRLWLKHGVVRHGASGWLKGRYASAIPAPLARRRPFFWL
jgi:hypothetical protein